MEAENRIKKLRDATGLSRKVFSEQFQIPVRTLEDWEFNRRRPPEYVVRLLEYKICMERDIQKREGHCHADIIKDADGNKIVLLNDLLFKGRRNVSWDAIEKYLKGYIGANTEVIDTSDIVYIGSDFPDEFCHSKDTRTLKGANLYAKANSAAIIHEMIEIASGKTFSENYKKKHADDAKYGWYRYDTRFGIPVYDEKGEIERYNIFLARLLVRHAHDGKLYLYDILRTKKETSKPLEP